MNWFLLLIILHNSALNWAAPIDSDVTDKYIFDQLYNKTFASSDSKKFTQKWENLADNKESVSNTSSLNEILDTQFYNKSEHLRKKLEENSKKKIAEVAIENKKTIEEQGLYDLEVGFLTSSQSPAGSSIENVEVLPGNYNDQQPFVYSQPILSPREVKVDQVISEVIKENMNETEASTDLKFKQISNVSSTFEHATDFVIEDVVDIGSQFGLLSEIILHEKTPAIDETVTENMKQKDFPSTNEKLLESITLNTQFTSENLHGRKDLEANFDSKQSSSHPDTKIETNLRTLLPVTQKYEMEDISASSRNIYEHIVANQDAELDTNKNFNEKKLITEKEASTPYAYECTSVNPAREQTSDSLIKATIDHSMENTTEEKPSFFSSIYSATEDSINSKEAVILNETITKPEALNNFKSEEMSKQNPAFKQALDSFFENVVEIGREQTKDQMEDKTGENITTFPSSLEVLKENFDNKSIQFSNSDRSNCSRSFEHLTGLASANERIILEFISASKNKSGGVSKSLNESSTETTRNEEEINLENFNSNFELSTASASPENVYETTKTSVKGQQNNIEKSTTTQVPLDSTIFDESLEDKQSNADHLQVAEITFLISETETRTTQQPEIATDLERKKFNETKALANEVLWSQPTAQNKDQSFAKIIDSKISETNKDIKENLSIIYEPLKTNAYTTVSYPILQETTTTVNNIIEETTKQEQKHSNTNLPSSATHMEEFTTISPLESITILPHKFEKEETTDQHFQEFQNNLKEFMVLGEANANVEEAMTSSSNFDNQTTFTKPEDETSTENSASQEPHPTDSEKQIPELRVGASKLIQTTEAPFDFSTVFPAVEKFGGSKEDQEQIVEDSITMSNDIKEDTVTTTTENNITEEITDKAEPATTEYISETTSASTLVRAPLQKNSNRVSLNTIVRAAAESTTNILSSESSLQEVGIFIEHTDATTNTQPFENEDTEFLTTTQAQETLTQDSFIKEQHIQSTTADNAKKQSAAITAQTPATTENIETIEQQTREAEINSTVVMEDIGTTLAAVESDTLPSPPKLEFLHSEDGVEVYYGYSVVKHN